MGRNQTENSLTSKVKESTFSDGGRRIKKTPNGEGEFSEKKS